MKFIKCVIIVSGCFLIAGCGTDCMNSNGPNAGQCKHYPDKYSCAQVSPYHQTCSQD